MLRDFSFEYSSMCEGAMLNLWRPLLSRLEEHVQPCAKGYIRIMRKLLCEDDSAFLSDDAVTLTLLYRIFPYLYVEVLPYIEEESMVVTMQEIIEGCKQPAADLAKGCIKLPQLSGLFVNWSTDFHKSLNNWKCKCEPEPEPPAPLINLNLLRGLGLGR